MKLALLLLFSAGLQAQTTVPPAAIRPGPVIGIMACLPPGTTALAGKCVVVEFDSTIVLDQSVSPPVLRAAPQHVHWNIRTSTAILTSAQSTFAILDPGIVPGSLSVYRNGILMTQGPDYTQASVAEPVVFTTAQMPQIGDTVTLKYMY